MGFLEGCSLVCFWDGPCYHGLFNPFEFLLLFQHSPSVFTTGCAELGVSGNVKCFSGKKRSVFQVDCHDSEVGTQFEAFAEQQMY